MQSGYDPQESLLSNTGLSNAEQFEGYIKQYLREIYHLCKVNLQTETAENSLYNILKNILTERANVNKVNTILSDSPSETTGIGRTLIALEARATHKIKIEKDNKSHLFVNFFSADEIKHSL